MSIFDWIQNCFYWKEELISANNTMTISDKHIFNFILTVLVSIQIRIDLASRKEKMVYV